MRGGLHAGPAPRPLRVGALLFALLVLTGGPAADPARAQEPPDTLPPEKLPADTTPRLQVPDSIREQLPDSLQEADSVDTDTLPPPRNLPDFHTPVPEGFHTGVWEWDREDLLLTPALTLSELLTLVPGVIGIRGGDFGMPRTASAFGLGGGRIRVFLDGMELAPLEGGVPDLARIGLAGVGRVRVERRGGELRVDLFGLRYTDPRPYSLVETGTGDLDTNIFRGTFAHPRALGGTVGVALDRIDTDGPSRELPSSVTGGWLRYTVHGGETWGVQGELRKFTSDRDTAFAPADVSRTDLALRVRYRPAEEILTEVSWGSSSLDGGDDLEDAAGAQDLNEESRGQLGARVSLETSRLWAEAGFRTQSGAGWPSSTGQVVAGLMSERLGGVELGLDWERWSDAPVGVLEPDPDVEDPGDPVFETKTVSETRLRARAWTGSLLGFSIFGEVEEGVKGVPFPPFLSPDDEEESPAGDGEETGAPSVLRAVHLQEGDAGGHLLRLTDRSFRRWGGRFRWRGLSLAGARLRVESDVLAPLGLPMDRAGVFQEGGVREGWELEARVPLLLGPIYFHGTYQDWDDLGEDPPAWRYLPDRVYDGRLSYHDLFFRTGDGGGNLELRVDAGVQGRDPMLVPLEDSGAAEPPDGIRLLESPFYLNWYAWVEIRIVTVRIFLRWENITNHDRNLDFPGRRLPGTRAMYGVRWTLWN